jgi:FkbM family methyltransferase
MISVYVDGDYDTFSVDWPQLMTIIDVGATTGAFTLRAAKRAPQARIIAVEPNPAVYSFLVTNVQLNGLANRIATVPTALGAVAGHGDVVDLTYSTLATVVPRPAATTSSVPIETLEQLMDRLRVAHCDFLKIDCEGGEYDILLSCSDALLKRVTTLICEFHPMPGHSLEELLDRLAVSGFKTTASGGPVGFIYANR